MLITRSRSQPTTEESVFASTYGETAREIVTINDPMFNNLCIIT